MSVYPQYILHLICIIAPYWNHTGHILVLYVKYTGPIPSLYWPASISYTGSIPGVYLFDILNLYGKYTECILILSMGCHFPSLNTVEWSFVIMRPSSPLPPSCTAIINFRLY